MSQALTPALVASAICAPGCAQIDLFDSVVPGFSLRVGKGGKKTWNLMHRVAGKRVRMLLGNASLMSLAEARNAARQVLGTSQIKAPVANSNSFDALADIFLGRPGIKSNTAYGYRRMIEVELLPAWRGRTVASLTRDDVFKVLDPIVKRGAVVLANRTQRLIVGLLGVAVERGWIQANVARGIKPVGGRERTREVALNLSELAKLWKAFEAERSDVKNILRLVILTAARNSEVRRMEWREVDLIEGVWTLPATRAKNGRERLIYLPPGAQGILDSLYPFRSGLVFPDAPIDLVKYVVRSCKRAGVKGITVHDLRRTAATLLAAFGTPRVVLKLILGHTDNDITAIYDRHAYNREQSQALRKLDEEIRSELATQGK